MKIPGLTLGAVLEDKAAIWHAAKRRARRGIRVVCLECDKHFTTANMLPDCPKCGGSDIEPEEL